MPRPYLKRAALWLALRRKPPTEDVLGDAPRDYFLNYLREPKEEPHFIVQAMSDDGVSGLWFEDRAGAGSPKTLTNEQLKVYDLSFVHQYHGAPQTEYGGLTAFFWGYFTAYPRRRVWWDRIRQWGYNRKTLVKAGRLEVLRFFLARTIKQRDYRADVTTLMAQMFSMRVFEHPAEKELSSYYEMVLESLAQSGDLQPAGNGQGYSLTGHGLTTLSVYEEDERRHRDNWLMQLLIGTLTLATVGVAVWQEFHPDPAQPVVEQMQP